MGTGLLSAWRFMPRPTQMKDLETKQLYTCHKSKFKALYKLCLHIYRAFMLQLRTKSKTFGSLSSGTIQAPGKSPFCSFYSFCASQHLCSSLGSQNGTIQCLSTPPSTPHLLFIGSALSKCSFLSPLDSGCQVNSLLQRTAFSSMSFTVRLPVSGCLRMCLQYQCLEWQ